MPDRPRRGAAGPEAVVSEGRPGRAVDHAVDLLVHLPLGLVLELPTQLPRFIDRGRRELELAKVRVEQHLGESVLDAEGGIVRIQHQATATLRALGLLAPDDTEVVDDHGARHPGPSPVSTGFMRAGGGRNADEGVAIPVTDDPDGHGTTAPAPTVASAPSPAPAGPSIDVETLAIPDYDSLSASQVIPRLDGLSTDELEAVRQYEAGARGRKTILSRIAQLQES